MKRMSDSFAALGVSLGALLLLAIVHPARAANTEVCVSNDSELASALADARYWPPITVKLVQGTYHLSQTKWSTGAAVAGGFKLLGGYTAACAGRDIALGNTVLQGAASIFMHGNMTFEGLTWKGFVSIDANVIGSEGFGPIEGTIVLEPGREILFRRDAFLDGGSFTIDWGQDDDAGGVLRLVDSVLSGSGACAAEFDVIAGGAPVIQLVNNTIVGNDGGVCVYARFSDGWGSGHPSISAFNNIFYGNTVTDLYTGVETSSVLVDNVVGTHDYNGFVSQLGTQIGDPKLDANFRPIEAPASPVVNSGSNVAPGGLPEHDLDGGPRVVGTTVDRGAYESGISDALIKLVTNTTDHDAGSLRSAILSVNQNGAGLITFDVNAGCPQVITLNSELDALTNGAVINGYTQTGTSPNDLDRGDDATLCVILESGNSSVKHGIQVASDAGDAVAVSVKGLGFSGFSEAAIDLQGGSGHFIAGNHFGGSIGGHALQPNGVDIRLGSFAHDATIGGDDVGDRNIIGDTTGSGIVLQGSASPPLLFGTHDNQVLNNYIGVGWSNNASGYTNRGNGMRGIHLSGHDNTIGGNLIGYNVQAGILVDGGGAAGNIIDGNSIGIDANDSNYTALGNGNAGIHFAGDTGDAPSGNTVRYNVIWKNGNQGVLVSIGQGNRVRKNSIYFNDLLGIDLAAVGVTANDDDGGIQQNDYANRGQNFPVITGATGGYQSGHVSGTLTTTGGDYTVDVYLSPDCDASGHGEGYLWLKSKTVTVTVPQGLDQGTAPFDIAVATQPPLGLGGSIIATATDAAGNTSEFSACFSYVNDTIFANGFD